MTPTPAASASLVATLAAAAATRPDHPAVVDGDQHLTYAELHDRALRIAATLRSLGVEPGDRVAVWLPKSLHAVAALYGVMAAGAAYVPLDPKAPAARSARIVTDGGVRVIVTGSTKPREWPVLIEQAGTI